MKRSFFNEDVKLSLSNRKCYYLIYTILFSVFFSLCFSLFVLYGKETKGLPEDLLKKYLDTKTIRIPMLPTLRSLNLSNAVAIITYEILRQNNFEDLQEISNYFDK